MVAMFDGDHRNRHRVTFLTSLGPESLPVIINGADREGYSGDESWLFRGYVPRSWKNPEMKIEGHFDLRSGRRGWIRFPEPVGKIIVKRRSIKPRNFSAELFNGISLTEGASGELALENLLRFRNEQSMPCHREDYEIVFE